MKLLSFSFFYYLQIFQHEMSLTLQLSHALRYKDWDMFPSGDNLISKGNCLRNELQSLERLQHSRQ
jgi:hypothetical protein